MPHSVTPEPTMEQEDAVLPDAPPTDEPSSSDSDTAPGSVKASAAEHSDKENNNLEDMFDDDDEDDAEFSSSAPQTSQQQAAHHFLPSAPSSGYSDPEVMRAFYQRLFPFRYLFQWLNHSPSPQNDFAHREFAFTLPNDAYLRYQSFATADLLRKQCVNMLPSRFEIGPMYSTNPRDRKTLRKASAFRPLMKELVFDIDMTDYDDIRTCCTGATICRKCWAFITMAIKVTDTALREDFGFNHIMWVYSGRRGAHAWVCDKRARELDDAKRKAVAGYLELLKGGDKSGKRVNVKRPLHPHLERSLRILREHFVEDILEGQDVFASEEKAKHLLDLLPDASLAAALQRKWDSAPGRSSMSKWEDIDPVAKSSASSSLDGSKLKEAKVDIILEYTYPRLDAEVSKKLNHLLKSPFCVHPATGRVCVPINIDKVEEFNPLEVPTVTDLLTEIDQWDHDRSTPPASKGKKLDDWEKTSLKPYVDHFRGFVNELLKAEQSLKRGREEGDPMEF